MDADRVRMRRYEEALYSGDMTLGHGDRRKTREALARAVIAVADEEQAELRADVERLRLSVFDVLELLESERERTEAAEAELIDARKRLVEAHDLDYGPIPADAPEA